MRKILPLIGGATLIAVVLSLVIWSRDRGPDVTKEPFAGLVVPANLDEPTRREMQRKLDATKALYEKGPDYWESWVAVGNLRGLFGDYRGAIKAYEKSTELEPSNVLGPHNIAEVYFTNLKNYEKAAEYYKKAIDINWPEPDNYLQLALVQKVYLNQPDEAEKTYLLGLTKIKDNPQLLISLARFYKDRGQTDKYAEYQAKFDRAKAEQEGKEPDLTPVIPVKVN